MPDTEENTPATTPEDAQSQPPAKTFTQEDVNRIVGERVASLKAKADAYDKAQDAAKTEAQRQADLIAGLQNQVAAYEAAVARRQAAEAAHLPPEAVALVTGTTDQEINESIAQIQAVVISLTQPRRPAPDPSQGRGPGNAHATATVAEARDKYSKKYTTT